MNAKSALDQASADLHDANLEAFSLDFMSKVTFQKRLEDGQQRCRARHSNGEHQEVPLESGVDLRLSQKTLFELLEWAAVTAMLTSNMHSCVIQHAQRNQRQITWKLPAVGFIAATYWQSLMFCTVSLDVAYLDETYLVQ